MEDKTSRKLQDFYEFDDADLEANRNGRMTDKQTQMMAIRNRNFRRIGYLGGGFFLFIALLALCLWLMAFALWSLTNTWAGFLGGTVGAGIGVVGGAIGATLLLRYRLSRGNGKFVFKKTEGPVAVEKIHTSSSGTASRGFTEYHMTIGGVEFVLDDELVHIIKNGELWAFYYLDFQNGLEGLILSAEQM